MSRTSPTRQQARAPTNHQRRSTRSMLWAGMAAAARVRATRTAGLATYSSARSDRTTAAQAPSAARPATAIRLHTAVTRPTLPVIGWVVLASPDGPDTVTTALDARPEGSSA